MNVFTAAIFVLVRNLSQKVIVVYPNVLFWVWEVNIDVMTDVTYKFRVSWSSLANSNFSQISKRSTSISISFNFLIWFS